MLYLVIGFLILVFIFVLLFSYLFAGFSLAPWVPSPKKDRERISKLADLKPGQSFYELGCGDGRVCRYIAKNNPGARIIGIELSMPVFMVAKFLGLFGPKNSEIRFGSIFSADLSDADVLFTYALINPMKNRLKPKLYKELKKSAKLISYKFEIDNWEGNGSVDRPGKDAAPIYIYEL
jgi:SAM-dependent methyltransferase